jgi:hypothetical protein
MIRLICGKPGTPRPPPELVAELLAWLAPSAASLVRWSDLGLGATGSTGEFFSDAVPAPSR